MESPDEVSMHSFSSLKKICLNANHLISLSISPFLFIVVLPLPPLYLDTCTESNMLFASLSNLSSTTIILGLLGVVGAGSLFYVGL